MKTQPVRIKTILFDMDGTLIDTEKVAALAVQECFTEWQIQLQPEDVQYLTGRTWGNAFHYLFSKYTLPVSEEKAAEKLLNHYRYRVKNQVEIIPGSTTAVRLLASQFKLGLVSGSHRSDILWALKKLGIENFFQIILGAEDYPRSKPHPDGYLKAIQHLQDSPEACLIFEDSQAGISSGLAAGAWVVAITHANHFNQDYSQAHFVIPDFLSVTPEWVEHLSFDSH